MHLSNTLVSALSVACLLVGSACTGSDSESGPANPRISEVETTVSSNGNITIRRAEFVYQSDKLKELRYFENGADAGRLEVSYDQNKFGEIVEVDRDGDRASHVWTYADGRVTSVSYIVPSISTIERRFEYDDTRDGREKQVTILRSVAGQANSETSYQYFRYDDDDLLEEIDSLAGDDSLVEELSYNADRRLERATRYRNNNHVNTHNFRYGVDLRLEEITSSDNQRYSLVYDRSGRLSQTTLVDAGTTTTVRYSYESGTTTGFSLAPVLPYGELIDLRGNTFGSIELSHSYMPQPGDIPRATGGGGDGGGDGGGGGGGDGGGGGGGDGNACSVYDAETSCQVCLYDSCCDSVLQCDNSLACNNYLDCEDTCTSYDCIDDCRYAHPTGASEVDSFRSCAQSYCGSPCDL